jgi:hypothetical protein
MADMQDNRPGEEEEDEEEEIDDAVRYNLVAMWSSILRQSRHTRL